MDVTKPKIGLVVGCLPSVEEIDQFLVIAEMSSFHIITSESIASYITQNSYFQDLTCIVLKDHDENPTFLPGLENVLKDYDLVIVKERIGLYAYQVLKAKWRYQFRMFIWVDNLVPFPANDVDQMRTIRTEVSSGADGFLVQTSSAKATLELEGVSKENISVVRPHVKRRFEKNAKLRGQARETLGLAEGDLVICCLGQIEWEEGLQDLIAATKLVIKKKPKYKDKIKLLICGIGSFANDLKEASLNFDADFYISYYAPTRDAVKAIIAASDAQFLSTMPGRDRIDGDPFRLLNAMTHGLPVIASRSPLVEQLTGKHRLDFCLGSPVSLANAIFKLDSASSLVADIRRKNLATVDRLFDVEGAKADFEVFINGYRDSDIKLNEHGLDHQVLEVEAKIKAKQYVAAIDLIEAIFKSGNMPVHHRSNLYRMIGDCFVKMGDYEASKTAYITAAELDPYSARTYIGLGTICLMKNSCDIAVLHFQKAISLAPDDEMANLGLGLAFQGMNEWNESLNWISKSLQIQPENTAALFSLVKASHEVGKFDKAESALLKYLSIHPNDYNFIYSLGGIYHKTKRYEETIALMKSITDIDPRDQKAAALLKQAQTALEETSATSSNG
ncbi:MAG: glycosyltransferase [Pseudobacteriovorax sp.]|nr:glycosyltransferase [Pseudobacteriovorax sp.]